MGSEGMRVAGRIAWLLTCLALGLGACVNLPAVEMVRESRPIDRRVTRRVSPGPWSYAAEVEARRSDRGASLQVVATRHHQCEITERLEHDVRVTTVRTGPGTFLVAAGTVLGLASAAAIASGLVDYQNGEPFSRKEGSSNTVTGAGNKVYLGSVGVVLLLLPSLHHISMSIDSYDNLGRRTTTETRVEECERQPAAATLVALKAGDRTLAEARTDREGRAELPVAASVPRQAPLRLEAEGRPLASHPEVATLIPEEPASRQAAAQVTPPAPPEAPRPIALLPTVTGSEPGGLIVVGVPVKGATRGLLDAAVAGAGGRAAASDLARVSRYDISAFNLPGLSLMELIYDDDGLFIAARLSGEGDAGAGTALLDLLRSRYGTPIKAAASGRLPARQVWSFAEEMELYFFTVGAQKQARVVIRDAAAQRAFDRRR